jgi:hypothetical protein
MAEVIWMSIELVPDLMKYPHIYDAHKNQRLIIFIGAGLSALWGCKRWRDMAIALIDACYERGEIDYWVRESLLTKYAMSPRKLITIGKSILDKNYIEKGEELIAYWKYKWLSPLRENFSFSALYEEAKQIVKPKDNKPYEPNLSEVYTSMVSHKSPISKEEVLQMPNAELVKYLKEFKGADFWHGAFDGEPDREGLADVLKAAVKENPKKFVDDLNIFFDVGYFYVHRILMGIRDAWTEKKEIDWEKFFDFSLKYLGREKEVILKEAFQNQDKDNNHLWIVENIVDLIEDGCQEDKHAFDPKYFSKAEQIFNLVLPLLKVEKHPDTLRDALTYALNTTFGSVVKAYISFALRVAGVIEKNDENWGQKRYERFFSIGIEAYIWFGCYLLQLRYLDEKYTKEKIEFFAQKPINDFEWRMFMEGYLTGSHVYRELYYLMRTNYLKALEYKNFEESVDERLVRHISIGYLQHIELLQPRNIDEEDSLFWKMLSEACSSGRRDRWLEVVNFFRSLIGRKERKGNNDEEEISEEVKRKILEFWAWTFNNPDIVNSNLGEDYYSFLEKLAEFTILLEKIDEEKEKWLLLCIPHIDRYSVEHFIEYLSKFDDTESIKRIGKIFLKILENTTPTYKKDDIKLIVRRIYKLGDRNDAETICVIYGRRGVDFLKPLWEEFNKS